MIFNVNPYGYLRLLTLAFFVFTVVFNFTFPIICCDCDQKCCLLPHGLGSKFTLTVTVSFIVLFIITICDYQLGWFS